MGAPISSPHRSGRFPPAIAVSPFRPFASSQSTFRNPAMHIAFADWADYREAHARRIKAETRNVLNRFWSDFFYFRLNLFRMNHVLVSDNGFAHPHDLVSGTL